MMGDRREVCGSGGGGDRDRDRCAPWRARTRLSGCAVIVDFCDVSHMH